MLWISSSSRCLSQMRLSYLEVLAIHLSEAYMCFSTTPTSFAQSASTSTSQAFTGQTNGAGPSGNGFTFPLYAIRRVERLNSQNFQVGEPHLTQAP